VRRNKVELVAFSSYPEMSCQLPPKALEKGIGVRGGRGPGDGSGSVEDVRETNFFEAGSSLAHPSLMRVGFLLTA
jgi:hypothetical protein